MDNTKLEELYGLALSKRGNKPSKLAIVTILQKSFKKNNVNLKLHLFKNLNHDSPKFLFEIEFPTTNRNNTKPILLFQDRSIMDQINEIIRNYILIEENNTYDYLSPSEFNERKNTENKIKEIEDEMFKYLKI
jgi:hypothetical protein